MAEPDYSGMDSAALLRMLKRRDHQARLSREYWVRAAEKALAGDFGELRNRVELAKMPDVKIVQSREPDWDHRTVNTPLNFFEPIR